MSSPATLTATVNGTEPTVAALENLPDAVLLLDEAGTVTYANAAAERLFGDPTHDLANRVFPGLLAEPFEDEYAGILRSFANGEPVSILGKRREVLARGSDGSGVTIELTLSEVRLGQSRSLAAVARDIREQKMAEARLRQMADQDSLTGLVNRTGFEHALTQHAEYAARYGSGGSVIALGIDSFKYVNESLGSAAGDELLVELVELIRGRLRKTDVLGRVAGDVFGLLVHGADRSKALALAEELLERARRHAFVVMGEGLRITLSAGVTSLGERPVLGTELLAEAEAAMHSAKESGRDRAVGFDSEGPNKPTLYVTIPNDNGVLTSQLQPFANVADYVGADYYPVGKANSLEGVSNYASETRETTARAGTNPVFVLQAFSWSSYDPSMDDRFPTRSEMQQMRDMAIGSGDPQMLLWYAFNDVMRSSNPTDNWESVKAAAFAPYVRVTGLSGKRCVGRLKAKVSVRANSAIRKVRANLDGRAVLKTSRETAKLPRLRLAGGRHVLRVTATDRQGKAAVRSLRFRICARSS